MNILLSSAEDLFRVNMSTAEGKSRNVDLILQGQLDYKTARLYNI